MNLRRLTSLTAALSFVLMVLTSVVLYIVPQGRVAYWADWKLWGLTKTDWGNIHINLGLLFLVALFLHVYYNWKPLMTYLKDKARRVRIFTAEFNAALIVTIVFVVGTYLMLPPFSWVMSLNDHFKDSGAVKYGEPPYGHAELSSLKTFAKKLNLDLAKSMDLLKEAGYPVDDSGVTLQALGKRYGVPPQRLYETIKPASIESTAQAEGKSTFPESPPPGTGNLTLADFCAQYNLNTKHILRGLKGEGITAFEAATLKEIASQHQMSPIDLFEILKKIVQV